MRPDKNQLTEWFESPTTEYFFGLISKRLDEVYRLRGDSFFPGEPYKTQEQISRYIGEERVYGELEDIFKSQSLEELEDGEHVGDSPEGRPAADQAGAGGEND